MKFAGEHLQEGLKTHDSKYFLYSILAVFCASYCGAYFLKLDKIPTIIIALGVALAVVWQFRLQGNIQATSQHDTLNNRSIWTIENSHPVSMGGVYQFILQVYLWCGLSMKRGNAVLTTHLAKLPMQFFKTIKIASGLMEKAIPWKLFAVNDSGAEFINLLLVMLMTNLVEPSHRIMIIGQLNYRAVADLFEIETNMDHAIDKISRARSMGRPLSVVGIGLSIDDMQRFMMETEIPVIPIHAVVEDSSLGISIGSPIMNLDDVDTYMQVESNRALRILH